MNTIVIILAVYYSGFAVAYAIAMRQIRKFKTNDSPWIVAFFSWVLVALFLVVQTYKLFRRDEDTIL